MNTIKRNSYLVNRTFRQFVGANILASVALYAGFIVGGIIVGNLLGKNALAAVNLCSPMIQTLFALATLINMGGGIYASLSIGQGHMQHAKRIFSTAMFMNLLFGIAIIPLALFFLDSLVDFICKPPELRPLVHTYLTITICSAPVLITSLGLCFFLRIDSAPKLVMIALTVANVINLCLVYVLIKYFAFGVAASAIASFAGFATGLVVTLFHFFNRKRILAFDRLLPFREWFVILWTGFPQAVSSLMMVLLLIYINRTIAGTFGVLGLAILSVCTNVLLFSNLFIGGILQTMQPVCSVMSGGKDTSGMRYALRTAFILLMSCLLVTTLLLEVFPFQTAAIFGVNDMNEHHHISTSIQFFSLCLPFSGIVMLFAIGYLSVGRKRIALFMNILQPLLLIGIMEIVKNYNDYCLWGSFVLSYLATIVVILILRVPLIPKQKGVSILLDASIHSGREQIALLSDQLAGVLQSRITNPLAETIHFDIMQAVRQHSTWKHMDILVKEEKDLLSVVLTDDSPYTGDGEWVLGQNVKTLNFQLIV